MIKPEYIFLHHSWTADGQTVNARAIRKYHKDKGWRDVGYHFLIEEVKHEIEVLVGRPMTMQGSHAKQQGMNRRSLGVCFIGNFDTAPPEWSQWHRGLVLVASLCRVFNIPFANIKGHHDIAPYKTCPGKAFDVQLFRENVASTVVT